MKNNIKIIILSGFFSLLFGHFLASASVTILPVLQGGTGWGSPGGLQGGSILFGNWNNPIGTSTNFTFSTSTNTLNTVRISLSSTSPFGILSVSATTTATQSNLPLVVVATSTGSASPTVFIIDKNGNVGIGTSTPARGLTMAGNFVQEKGFRATSWASTTQSNGLMTIDPNWSSKQRIFLNGSLQIALTSTSSNLQDGAMIWLKICQDSAGSRALTFVTPGQIRWAGITPATSTLPATAFMCLNVGGDYDAYQGLWTLSSTTAPLK